MKQRCGNTRNPEYHNYGGRGIRVCERWANSLASFASDMGERPEGKQLDRIDTNGHYEPSNCRWVTPVENCSNRRNNQNFTYKDRTQTMFSWAREFKIGHKTLRHRLFNLKWTIDMALETPVKPQATGLMEYNGVKKSRRQWARDAGISASCLRKRLESGMNMGAALAKPSQKNKLSSGDPFA